MLGQKFLRVAAAAIIFFFALAPRSEAQVLYGSIVGTLTDPTGSAVPEATITITNKETGQTREAKSDAQGNFNITNVMPGRYDVRIAATGFRAITQQNLDVTASNVARINLALEVGQITESIEVSADAAQLQTDRAGTQSQITTKPVEAMPLSAYRNYQALLNLVPGATPATTQNSATDTPGRSLATNINGTAKNMNTTRTDGAVNVNIWLPHHNAYVSPSETIAEINVNTTALDPELGSAGGAAITVITKSGTNDLHGSAWEYHNNQRMKARPYFMPATQQKPRDTLNIFGGTLGGPIVRNRLFYFGHVELTRQRTGGSGIFDVPSAAVRTGNFSGTGATIFDPQTGQPFAGNIIPENRISPIARQILNRLPAANLTGERQNFAGAATGIFDRNNFDYKINWNRSDRHSIWGKSSFLVADVTGYGAFGEMIGPSLVQDPGTGHTFTQLHTLGHTYTITPNFLLEQTLGFTRQSQNVIGLDYGTNWGSDVFGIPGTNGPDIRQSGMPNFNFGYSNIGNPQTWIPVWRVEQTTTHSSNLSWVRGTHDVRFGFNMVRFNLNHWQPETANPRGNFDFNGNLTAGGATPSPYNTFAAFLLGMPNVVNKSLQFIDMTGREWQFDWYVRDRWQVSRKLTLNLGLKYAYYPLMTRRNSGLERLDPATGLVYLGGRGNVPEDAGLSINMPGFAPTVGFAYRVTENMVVRSGYGLTWDPLPFSRPLRGFYPYTITAEFRAPVENQAVTTLQQGIPAFSGPDVSSGIVPLPNNVNTRSPWGKINRGYIQSWNFTIENRLPANLVTSVAYVGTQSTHMLAERDINAAPPGTPNTQRPYALLYGRQNPIAMWDGWLSANYHSLQTSINRQFSNGLLLKGAYTFSKAINMTDENGWATVAWNWGPTIQRNRARAGYDRTHVFQLGYVFELPVGRGRRFLTSGPASWILGNWSLSGIFYAYTGTPFNPTGGGACNCPGGTQTPNQMTQDVQRIGNYGPGQFYYDPNAFRAGPANQFGSVGRNILTGPGRIGTDLSLARIFPITEKLRLEFRGDAFNLTNTPAFNNPVTSVTDPNFMQVRSTAALSERQLRVGAVVRF
jgi:hypothetical protein